MKKFIIVVLLALPCYIFAAPNSQQLFEEARKELNKYNHNSAIPKLKKAAEMGNTNAQTLLGTLYLAGSVIERNTALGLELLTNATQQNDATAQYMLGSIYLRGDFKVKSNLKLAEKYLLESANQENPTAQLTLGNAYHQGTFGEKNLEKARYWYEKSFKQGELEAMQMLGWMTLIGEGGKKDEMIGFMLISTAASQGNNGAQYMLGLLYANGSYGVPEDIEKARMWLTKALKTIPQAQEALDKLPKQKNEQAQIETNYTYKAHLAYKSEEYDIAKLYALKAIKQNNDASAQYILGGIYYFGNGEPRDYQQAVYWFKKSANQNLSAAQLMLGRMYLYGSGVTQDFEKAYYWLLKAAQQNDDLAQFEIAKMYATGKGVKQDDNRFIDWLFKAAENGNQEAKELANEIMKLKNIN